MVLITPVGIDSSVDKIPFYPYFYFKDLFSVLVFITFFSVFVFYYPNSLGHPDNYIPSEPYGDTSTYSARMVFFTVLCNSKIYTG